jgi:hypothetical protein
MAKMEVIDITSDSLKNQGYSVRKEGATIVLYQNGFSKRVGFYKVKEAFLVLWLRDQPVDEGI